MAAACGAAATAGDVAGIAIELHARGASAALPVDRLRQFCSEQFIHVFRQHIDF